LAHQRTVIQKTNDAMAEITRQYRLMDLPVEVLRLQAAELVMTECAEMIDRTARHILDHGRILPSYWRYLRENVRDLHNNVLAVEPLEDMATNAGEIACAAAD
jgi:hypothetical protein